MSEFSRIYDLSLSSTLKQKYHIYATEEERRALAKRFNIPTIERLEADFSITPDEEGQIFQVMGILSAYIVQQCSVTSNAVDETIDTSLRIKICLGQETENCALDEEDIEYSQNGKVDLGELMAQYLSLAMEPFPRHPSGATLETEGVLRPFDTLRSLKKKT